MAYIEITNMLIVYLKTALVTSAHLSVCIILDFAGDKMLENNKLRWIPRCNYFRPPCVQATDINITTTPPTKSTTLFKHESTHKIDLSRDACKCVSYAPKHP